MLKHNLVLFFRNIKRHKSTFLINHIGLTCGLACFIVIYLWINDELSFDKYHQNDSRLYQVMVNTKGENGIETGKNTSHTLAEILPLEMPDVEYATASTPDKFLPAFTLSANNKKIQGFGKFAGKDFFKMFSYNIIEGNESTVLSNKNGIVLSQSQALKLFGSTDKAIGNVINWETAGLKRTCVVTGVFKDVPVNSSEHFDFVLCFDDLKDIMQLGPTFGAEPFCTYLTLRKGTDVDRFNARLTQYLQTKGKDANRSFFLQHFSDSYLYSKYENGKVTGGRIEYVKLFALIALFILVISAINYMNLSTARAASRIKEIGVKKAIGAGRKVLLYQYLSESVLMSFLSLMVALGLVFLLLPQVCAITHKSLTFHFSIGFCMSLIGITLFTGLLSGSYPAFYLSGFKPAMVLKGVTNSPSGEKLTRKGLVILQFSLSVIFIVSVLVLYKQIVYIENKNLGFDKNNVVYFESDGKLSNAYLNEIAKIPSIESASSMLGHILANEFGGKGQLTWNGKTTPVQAFGVNYGLIETLGMKMKEGRSFSKTFSSNNHQLIINEAAAEAIGLKNPVGTLIKGREYDTEIIGVVKNFHFQSLHERIGPMSFRLNVAGPMMIVARVRKGQESQALHSLENIYKKFNPEIAFKYQFLDQDFQALYTSEKLVSTLSRYFAGISILISCLGLFGLAAYTTQIRTKEIGIRKVLGSGVMGIVKLLNSEFIMMILLSLCIALPVSYLLAKNWLDNFAYHINLQWWYFLASGAIIVFISVCTVSLQTIKAALINPAHSLKAD